MYFFFVACRGLISMSGRHKIYSLQCIHKNNVKSLKKIDCFTLFLSSNYFCSKLFSPSELQLSVLILKIFVYRQELGGLRMKFLTWRVLTNIKVMFSRKGFKAANKEHPVPQIPSFCLKHQTYFPKIQLTRFNFSP